MILMMSVNNTNYEIFLIRYRHVISPPLGPNFLLKAFLPDSGSLCFSQNMMHCTTLW